MVLGGGFALLLAAWVIATQPFAAPDEASHYLRALSLANGNLLGRKVPDLPTPAGLTPTQIAWINGTSRAVHVPAALSPPDVACMNGKPDTGAGGCTEATEVGNYLPVAYLLPAVALKVSHTANTALWLSRLASALPCLALILLALALLWDGSLLSIMGLLAALTPMFLFVCSVVNPNGLELAASLACAAATVRIARDPHRAPVVAWVALALGGAVAILAFQLGPVFVLADIVLGAALLGRSAWPELVRAGGRRLWAAATVLLVSVIAFVVYGAATNASSAPVSFTPFVHNLRDGLSQLGPALSDSIGNFGAQTIQLPNAALWIWWLLVAAIIAGAIWLGSHRDRLFVAIGLVLALALPVLFQAWVHRGTGFGLQGRYVMPVLALIPLLAGEVIRRRWDKVSGRPYVNLVPAGVLALVAIFQGYAWWFDARAVAGAPGTLRFYAHATWKPPLGWLTWITIAALGVVALLWCAGSSLIDAARRRQPEVVRVASPG